MIEAPEIRKYGLAKYKTVRLVSKYIIFPWDSRWVFVLPENLRHYVSVRLWELLGYVEWRCGASWTSPVQKIGTHDKTVSLYLILWTRLVWKYIYRYITNLTFMFLLVERSSVLCKGNFFLSVIFFGYR